MTKEEFNALVKAFDEDLHHLQKQMEHAFYNYREMEKAYQCKQLEKIEFLTGIFNKTMKP